MKDLKDKGYITTKIRENLLAENIKVGVMKINGNVPKKVKENGVHPARIYVSGIQGLGRRRKE